MKPIALLAGTSAFALLSACMSDGAGSVTAPSVPSLPSYEDLSSTAAKTSSLSGVALRQNNSTRDVALVSTSGSVTHDTGETTITDGTYSLTDSDGFDISGTLTDGSATITSTGTVGTYGYVSLYDQTYTVGGTTYESTGVGGITTQSADMPATGTATYTGEARGVIATSSQNLNLRAGTSTVTADFAGGTVGAVMTGFTAEDDATKAITTAPIDTIAVSGMTISGNGFTGGTISTTKGGAAVDVTGANTTDQAQGAFFGYDSAASGPDEVGGIVYKSGDSGAVAGAFLAD